MDAYRRHEAGLDWSLGFHDAVRQALAVLADRTDVPVEARTALYEDICRLQPRYVIADHISQASFDAAFRKAAS